MGRPKGSKNKPKTPAVAPTIDPATLPPAEVPKKRGRPPGSKNTLKPSVPQATQPPATSEAPKRRGRPPGSKNKPKDTAPTPTPPAATPAPTSADAPKRRGRPPKAVVPALPPSEVPPPPIPAGATKSPTSPAPVVVTRTEAEDDAAPVERAAAYTREQLNNQALDYLEEHAKVFLTNASAHRKLMFEGKADDTLTPERAALRTLIDFFEIDVEALITNAKKTKDKAPTGVGVTK